jgi:hypothetical protein
MAARTNHNNLKFTRKGEYMRSVNSLSMLLILCLVSTVAYAQDRPFLFTLTFPDSVERAAFVHYDAAYGRETFEPFGGDEIEQNLGLQANLGKSFTLIAHVGLALDEASTKTSQHAELLGHVIRSDKHFVDISAGAGMRHEYSGTNVLLSRVVVGRQFTSWQVYGNLLLEKPLATDRDAIDLITTFGLSYRISSTIRLGLEAVGQDLEGFWDENEAEGGARLFVGPSVALALPGTPWTFALGGGAIFRGSQSARTSEAVRDLPVGRENGFVIRGVVRFGL